MEIYELGEATRENVVNIEISSDIEYSSSSSATCRVTIMLLDGFREFLDFPIFLLMTLTALTCHGKGAVAIDLFACA